MELQQVEGLSCQECKDSTIYYPEVHHLDGNRRNNSPGNLVLVCAYCHEHFVFRFSPKAIQILKMQGFSNAEIGRRLGISRERVRQIYERSRMELSRLPGDKIDDLARLALQGQEELMEQERRARRRYEKVKRRPKGEAKADETRNI